MSREEDAVRAATRAIAAAVRDVPPLELEPAPGELWSPRRGPRRGRPGGSGPRLRSWLAPVAAAAVVVAVAVSLVLIRGSQNGSMVPQPAATAAGPGGVPRYYVAAVPVSGKSGAANGLRVGDTVTGQVLADITPPAHMSYQSVTAAADDRTFLAFATESSGSQLTGRWYELRLAPGTAHLVSVTSTPLGPQPGVVGSALSGSGRELAVAETGPAKGQQRVVVFSVDTGRPLGTWSTRDASSWATYTSQQNLLTWIDGDRAIAFSSYDVATGTASVRSLNVGGPTGDLIADSQLIWSTPATAGPSCRYTTPLVSADGQTIACAATSMRQVSPDNLQWTSTWLVYRASAQSPAAGKYTIAYQVTRQPPEPFVSLSDTLWVSPSGSAVVGAWATAPMPALPAGTPSPGTHGSGSSTVPMVLVAGVVPGEVVQVGVMSHGTFTPLRLPQDIFSLTAPAIAW